MCGLCIPDNNSPVRGIRHVVVRKSSPAAASSTPQVGSTVSSSSVFGSSYNWMEYQTTTTNQGKEMSIDMKMERSTSTYNGQPAR